MMFGYLFVLFGGFLIGYWMGIGCFIVLLIIWLVKKDMLLFVVD